MDHPTALLRESNLSTGRIRCRIQSRNFGPSPGRRAELTTRGAILICDRWCALSGCTAATSPSRGYICPWRSWTRGSCGGASRGGGCASRCRAGGVIGHCGRTKSTSHQWVGGFGVGFLAGPLCHHLRYGAANTRCPLGA